MCQSGVCLVFEKGLCAGQKIQGIQMLSHPHSLHPPQCREKDEAVHYEHVGPAEGWFMAISYDIVVTGTVCWCRLNVNPCCLYFWWSDDHDSDDVAGRLYWTWWCIFNWETHAGHTLFSRMVIIVFFLNCCLNDFAGFIDVVLLSLYVI